MAKIVFGFYGLPINQAIGLMICLVFIWKKMDFLIATQYWKRVVWKIFNAVLAFGMIVAILAATISSRGGVSELILKPFYSLRQIPESPDLGRSMFMNIFLFFPLGLTLPFALPEKWNRKALIAILFAMVLSISVEFLQYYYHLGRAETDDVLCNTLGCAIGTLSYTLERKLFNK